MKKLSNIKQDYRGWKFWDKVALIPRDQVWKKYFDEKFADIDIDVDIDTEGMTDEITDEIIEAIENSTNQINGNVDTHFEGLDANFQEINEHIERAKEHLCCDICCAKNDIKNHIDNKLDEINFEEKFSNLNEQVETIINKLNEQ